MNNKTFNVGSKYYIRPYVYDCNTFIVFKVLDRSTDIVVVQDQDYHGQKCAFEIETVNGVERFKAFGHGHYDLEDYVTKQAIDLTVTADAEIPAGSDFDMLTDGGHEE